LKTFKTTNPPAVAGGVEIERRRRSQSTR